MTILHTLTDNIIGDVYLFGSWDNWEGRIEIKKLYFRCKMLIYASVDLPPGTYQYKFVDNCCYSAPEKWFHNVSKPTVDSPEGYINNIIHIPQFKSPCLRINKCCKCNDLLEYAIAMISSVKYMCVKCIIDNYKDDEFSIYSVNKLPILLL